VTKRILVYVINRFINDEWERERITVNRRSINYHAFNKQEKHCFIFWRN